MTFCADRRCDHVFEAIETDGIAVQPTRPLPVGVVFWRAYEAVGANELEPSGPTWWFVVPRVARDTSARASRDLGWTGMRDTDGDGRWDPLDHRGVVAVRENGQRVVRTWLADVGDALVTAVGDLDGDGYMDFVGADPERDLAAGRVLLWRGPLGAGEVAPWRSGAVASTTGARCGASPTLSGDFDGNGRRELAVSCPGALSERGEVYVVAVEPEGQGLGRVLRVVRAGASGVFDARQREMHALLAEDLDDDGYDDLVVGLRDARCEPLPVEGGCTAAGWLAVYLGGLGGLADRAPLVYAPAVRDGGALVGSSATLADFDERGPRTLVVGGHDLAWMHVDPTPSLTVDGHEGISDAAWAVGAMFALPRISGPDVLVTANSDAWFEVTRSGDGTFSRRPIGGLTALWHAELAEIADVQGDGVPDLVLHATGTVERRATIFAWVADATGRLDAPVQWTP